MELVEKLCPCFFSCSCKGDARSRLGGPKYFVSTDLNLNRALLTWPVARKIWYSKRKGKKKKRKRTGLGHQHGGRFLIGLGLTNIGNLTSSVKRSWRLYSQLQASRRAEQCRNLTTWWLRKILDCDLYFSLDRLNSSCMHANCNSSFAC